MTAFMVALGGTWLVCYWLMKRVQNGLGHRSSLPGDNASYDGSSRGTYDAGGGSNIFNWLCGDSSSTDHSGASDSCGRAGGGGDGGGGGGH